MSSSLGPGSPPTAGIVLAQETKSTIGNFREFVTHDTVQVLQPDLRLVEVRRFSWVKSGVGAVVVGVLGRAIYARFWPSVQVRR